MPFAVDVTPDIGTTPAFPYTGRFIPEIWSSKLLTKFYDSTVLAGITNTDYEGEISKYGDKVKIRTRPSLTIRDYTADGTLTIERPSSDILEFPVDKGKYFAAVLDDVMRTQMDVQALDLWSEDASEQLKIVIDTAVLASLPAGVVAANKGNAAGRKSGDIKLGAAAAPVIVVARNKTTGQTEIMDLIVDMNVVLDEQNIPSTGRWIVLPSWAVGMLLKSDLRDAAMMGDGTSVYRNGRVGTLVGFTVYQSNLLPTAVEGAATATHIFAGHKHGTTFASQLTQTETLRAESTFGTIIRGLQVYGHKVIDGIAIVDAYVVKA